MKHTVIVFAMVIGFFFTLAAQAQSSKQKGVTTQTTDVSGKAVFTNDEVSVYHNANTNAYHAINKSGQEVTVDFEGGAVKPESKSTAVATVIVMDPIIIKCKCVSKDSEGKCTKVKCKAVDSVQASPVYQH